MSRRAAQALGTFATQQVHETDATHPITATPVTIAPKSVIATSPKGPRSNIENVSPIDGRYARYTAPLSDYFSEASYIKYRVRVEVEYLIALCKVLPQLKSANLSETDFKKLRLIYEEFTVEDALEAKATERILNHDVKAIEYLVKDRLVKLGMGDIQEFVHFGLTSQDINNTAAPLAIKEFLETIYLPQMEALVAKLKAMARTHQHVTMLGHTHGQPATPTRLGKEIMVFAERIESQLRLLRAVPNTGKFGGATGGLNAHKVAYPDVDWVAFADQLYSEGFGMQRQQFTTQIEHYDNMAAQFDAMKRCNTIMIDLCRDMWQYIAMEYFKQKVRGDYSCRTHTHQVR
jgi:adenylosuccinate lyase